jgi:opacity protein-like surface antigen
MKSIKFFVFVLFCTLYVPLNAQVNFSAGPQIGVTLPQGDYAGTSTDYYNGLKYGLNTGLNFGAVFKAKLPVLNIRAAVNYSILSNSGLADANNPGSYVEVKHNVLMISVGPEFYFSIPASPIKPYAGVDLLISSISGESTFQGLTRVPSGTYSMSSAGRTGIGLGIGAEVGIGRKMALDISLRYNLINLFSKSYEGGYDANRIDSYLHLNDAKDPRYPDEINKHPIGNDRTISTLQLNLGILFGF